MGLIEIFIALVNGLGLMALVAVLYGSIERLRVGRLSRSVLQGLTFGSGAVIAMMSPAVLAPGVIVDTRTILVALAGAFVGPVAAVIAAIIPGAYRVWLGGIGLPVGLMTLTLAFCVGLTWRYAWFKRRPVTPFGLLLLGMGISLQCLLVFLIPVRMSTSFIMLFAGSLLISALFATQVLGTMMNRENRLIAREKSLINDAHTDALTGLPNRRAFYDAEASLIAASGGKGFVVLMIDIDHFKAVNDRHGHDAGDLALCVFAEMLKTSARGRDIVARFGGEEFVLALPDTGAQEGRAVAERLVSQVRQRRIVLAEAELGITISVGLAHAHGTPLLNAIARADVALYCAKAEGRDRVVSAAPEGFIASQRPAAEDIAKFEPVSLHRSAQRAR